MRLKWCGVCWCICSGVVLVCWCGACAGIVCWRPYKSTCMLHLAMLPGVVCLPKQLHCRYKALPIT